MKRTPFNIAWLAWVVLAASGAAAEGAFVWPLRLDPALSSTFGESRATAFHAGIDVKTWGKTGYEVQACADGYIWRVRTSPWGYGRTVYQKLPDGRTAVYAHLDRFAPQIAARVLQAQRQGGRYSVDLYFDEGAVPVRAGEVIAWSGQSGAGPPHLHFELRDPDNVPVNPLLHGFAVADSIAPTIQRVAITPYGGSAVVAGGHDPHVVGVRYAPERGEFAAAEPVQVFGWVGISALMYDRADAAPNKLAPYRAALEVDGRPVFAARYHRVSYDDRHQVYLDRSLVAYPGGSSRFFNLCRLPGNRLGFYEGRGSGLLQTGKGALGKGWHEVVVRAADINGNQSLARLRLLVADPPQIARARIAYEADGAYLEAAVSDPDDPVVAVELASSTDGETWREIDRRQSRHGEVKWRIHRAAPYWRIRAVDPAGAESVVVCRSADPEQEAAPSYELERRPHRDFVELVMRYDRVPDAAPLVRAGKRRLDPRQANPREYRAVVPLKPDTLAQMAVAVQARGAEPARLALDLQVVRPGTEQDLLYHDGAVRLSLAAASAYAPFFPQVVAFVPDVPGHLVAAGPGYALGPEFSFDRKVELSLRYDGVGLPADKLGVYREVGAGKWALVGNDLEGRRVSARLRRLGRYALMADLEPPVIDGLVPKAGAVVGARPQIGASLVDAGAGIGREEDIELLLDGRLLIAEYDPDADRIHGMLLDDLAPGPHSLLLKVRDKSGNLAEARSDFEVR